MAFDVLLLDVLIDFLERIADIIVVGLLTMGVRTNRTILLT